jgi:molecular chaperone GrpE
MDDEFVVDQEAEENAARQGGVDAKLAKLKAEVDTLRKEKQENMDGWQRAKADYVNALRRFEKEKAGAKEAGVTKAVEALLPAYDAIERAKEHGDVPEGFAAIVKQLESAFASLGLVSIGEVGEEFNPEIHEAYGQDVVEDVSNDGKVTAVLEKGWKQNDRVIRPAKVKVAKHQ